MQYKFQTNSKKIMGDLHTPVSIYLKVRDYFPQSALLKVQIFMSMKTVSLIWRLSQWPALR